jgi:hypothetical protein
VNEGCRGLFKDIIPVLVVRRGLNLVVHSCIAMLFACVKGMAVKDETDCLEQCWPLLWLQFIISLNSLELSSS